MTTGRVDKLRQRCEALLESGEEILLEAEATVKLGYLSDFGAGRAYLTTQRVLWIRRSTPLVRPLLFWIPDVVTIELSSIDRVRMIRQLTRAWLQIETGGKTYHIRLGKGPYPTLLDNPGTTDEWLRAIERLKSGHFAPQVEGPSRGATSGTKLAGALLILLSISMVPFWLAGLIILELPLVFFLIMGALTLVDVAVGFFLRRIS